jgi:Flp pilus assembly protein protease CpaA
MNYVVFSLIGIWFVRLMVTDYRFRKIYNRDLVWGIPLAGLVLYFCPFHLIAFLVAGFLSVFLFVYHYMARKLGYAGGGDVKMMTLLPFVFNPLSTWFHPGMFFYVVLLGVVFGLGMALMLKPAGKSMWKTSIPLAVPIGAAAITLLCVQTGASLFA